MVFKKGNHPTNGFKKGNNFSEKLKGRKVWNVGLTKEIDRRLKSASDKKKGKHFSPSTEFKKGRLAYNKGVSLFGEKNHNWQGGKTLEVYPEEFSKELKEKIKQRDNHICQLCNKQILERRRIKNDPTKSWLSIHHIDYNKRNNNPNNLITLCNFCNVSVNKDRIDWMNYFQDKIIKI